MQKTYKLLDAIRAVAALTVVISHCRELLFLNLNFLGTKSLFIKSFYFATGFGHEAVMVFFVLSDFWISKSIASATETNSWSWKNFLIDRISRLWVVLLPALLVGGALDLIGRYALNAPLYLGSQGANSITWDVGPRLLPEVWLGNIVFLQTLFVPTLGSNGPLWSLANEFWYYIWFATMYQFVSSKGSVLVSACLTIFTLLIFSKLIPGFICWLMGASVYFIVGRQHVFHKAVCRSLVVRQGLALSVFLFIGALLWSRVAVLVLSKQVSIWGYVSVIDDLVISATFSLLLILLLRAQIGLPKIFHAISTYGANSSYSLYVTHFPMVALVTATFIAPTHRYFPSLSLFASMSLLIILAVFYGHVFSRATEAHTFIIKTKLRALISSDLIPSNWKEMLRNVLRRKI